MSGRGCQAARCPRTSSQHATFCSLHWWTLERGTRRRIEQVRANKPMNERKLARAIQAAVVEIADWEAQTEPGPVPANDGGDDAGSPVASAGTAHA